MWGNYNITPGMEFAQEMARKEKEQKKFTSNTNISKQKEIDRVKIESKHTHYMSSDKFISILGSKNFCKFT